MVSQQLQLLTVMLTNKEADGSIAQHERCFLTAIRERFPIINAEMSVSPEDGDFLKQELAAVWDMIRDTGHDYLLMKQQESAPWVGLAKSLGPDSWVHTLMPTVINKRDHLSLNLLYEQDIRNLYLGEDTTCLYSVAALYEQLSGPTHVFATRSSRDSLRTRALSLNELRRLRDKREFGFQPASGSTVYKCLWDLLIGVYVPHWQRVGTVPDGIMDALYVAYNTAGLPGLEEKLTEWSQSILLKSHSDVNCFYGQPILFGGPWKYMIELLVDCIDKNAPQHMKALCTLAEHISSVCSQSYQSRPSSSQDITSSIDGTMDSVLFYLQLLSEKDPLMKRLQSEISMNASGEWDKQFLASKFQEAYAIVGSAKCGTELDFTREQGGVNALWIQLARALAQAGVVGSNYYRLLFPGLCQDIEPVTMEPVTQHPLSDYIVAEDGTHLIHLPSSKAAHQKGHPYLDWSGNRSEPARRLTPCEIARVKNAASTHRDYFCRFVNEQDPPINSTMVSKLGELVNAIFYEHGLLYGVDYTAAEMEISQEALLAFDAFFLQLPHQLQQALNAQTISVYSKSGTLMTKTFEMVYVDIKTDVCMALCSKSIIQLVLDYVPDYEFKQEINASALLKQMRQNSAKKVLLEYHLEQDEAVRRILILALSLMTTRFVGWRLQEHSLLGHKNRLTATGVWVAQKIETLLLGGGLEKANRCYQDIMEYLNVEQSPGVVTAFLRDKVTAEWIDIVRKGALFKQCMYWFEPELLYLALMRWNKAGGSIPQEQVTTMLHQIELVCKGVDATPAQKRLRVNVFFRTWLTGFREEERREVLAFLRLVGSDAGYKDLLAKVNDYLFETTSEDRPRATLGAATTFFVRADPLNTLWKELNSATERLSSGSSWLSEARDGFAARCYAPGISDSFPGRMIAASSV